MNVKHISNAPHPVNFFLMTRFGVYLDKILSQKIFLSSFWRNFESMLQLKYFDLYFERIPNKKWLLSYRNNDYHIVTYVTTYITL